MFQQHFFIEGKYLGAGLRAGNPHSMQFYCELCGTVFAKCPVDQPRQTWLSRRGACRRCRVPWPSIVPGSIWVNDLEFTAAFPDAVLRWEFDRHCEWIEQGN